jgi:hypothetical protein
MDECLGSFMSLWSYCDILLKQLDAGTQDRLLTAMAKRIATTHGHWLFRPDLQKLLNALHQAHVRHQITGCFILSNNGSAGLVELVRRILNVRTGSVGDPRTGLFYAGWHRTAPCRANRISKSFEGVKACLRSVGLPGPTTTSDLLFYDDLEHVMQKEIPHYVQVPAYFNTTPHRLVFQDLKPIFQREGVPKDLVDRAFAEGEAAETADLREDRDLIPRPPSANETAEHMSVFMEGFRRFMAARRLPTGTRRQKTGTMKHTRRHVKTSTHPNTPTHPLAKSPSTTKSPPLKKGIWSRY